MPRTSQPEADVTPDAMQDENPYASDVVKDIKPPPSKWLRGAINGLGALVVMFSLLAGFYAFIVASTLLLYWHFGS